MRKPRDAERPGTARRGAAEDAAVRGIAPRESVREPEKSVRIQRDLGRELRIEVEGDLNRIVVKIVDRATGEVVRQIPPSESIAVSRTIREFLERVGGTRSGVLVDREA